MKRLVLSFFVASGVAATLLSGCATTRTSDTSRTGMEQLLLSDAVDKTLDRMPMPPVEGKKVFVDTQFLDCVDKGYVVGSLRQRLLSGGAALVDKKEDSEMTFEICSGGVGTDNNNSYLGMPGIALPGPMPISLPEVRLYDKSRQAGTAKISLVAYDSASGKLVYDSGNALALSVDNRWSFLGVGPYLEGDVRNQVRSASSFRSSSGSRTANSGTTGDSSWR